MRNLILLVPVLLASGCVRENFLAVPDRNGHAYQLGRSGHTSGAPSMTYQLPERPGERVILLQPGQRLWQIAETYAVDLYALIERNDYTTNPYPSTGTKVIVPDLPQVR